MLSYAVKLHCLKPAICANPAVSMEGRRRRPGRRTASWVSANKIWAQNKATSNTIRKYSQLRTTGAGRLKSWAQLWAQLWAYLIPLLGLNTRKPQNWGRGIVNLFFPAGSFFFRSLRVQMYSIEGNKAISVQREFTV